MVTLANIHILADFKKHVHAILNIYADVTGNSIKCAVMRTKINMVGESVLASLKPHVVAYKEYIDAGDIDGFVKLDHSDNPYKRNIRKVLKILEHMKTHERSSSSAISRMPEIIERVQRIADTCLAYTDIDDR